MTGMGGIGTYLDLSCRSGMLSSIERHVKAREGGQGWTDAEHVLTLVMLNLVGGECVEDVNRAGGRRGILPVAGQGAETRFEPKRSEGLKEEMEERENSERAVQFIGISVFGRVS